MLEIQMLGAFRVTWQGEEIAVASNAAPRFLQLLQEVWLAGEEGITREALLRDLYEGRHLQNPCNSINNLILQARKHLSGAGLPPAGYIAHRKNLYWPDPSIPTVCDAARFHACIQNARQGEGEKTKENGNTLQQGGENSAKNPAEDPAKSPAGISAAEPIKKIEETGSCFDGDQISQSPERGMLGRSASGAGFWYREAVLLYGGRFLPQESGLPWVEREAGRLAREYREAVNFLISEALKQGEQNEAERLVECAKDVDPDGGWTQQRLLLPPDTVIAVPGEAVPLWDPECANTLSLELGALGAASGACCCSQESFRDIVYVVGSNMERTGCGAFLMLLELVDYKGVPIGNAAKRRSRMESLRAGIELNLRSGDALTQSGESAFIVLLVGYNEEERARVLRRIRTELRRREGGKARVKNTGVTLSELR